MALDRLTPTSSTPDEVTGDNYMDAVQEELTGLWDKSALPLSNVAGTADAITADCTPALTGALVDGMTFWFTPALTNTNTSVTMAIGGTTPVPIVDSQGDAPAIGALQAGLTRKLLFVGADNELRAIGTAESTKVLSYQAFTASGTWNKPASAPAGSWVRIEVWAGGGGGHTAGGGGGGAYNVIIKQLSDLGATETVTIGAGGVGGGSATAGGTTSFGSHISAYGGAAASNGGGGGGAMSAGSGDTGGAPGGGFSYTGSDSGTDTFEIPFPHSSAGGGKGAGSINVVGDSDTGGGGGAINSNGGKSRMGGGGGAGNGYVGGTSQFGGNGGDSGADGSAPGGGGGYNGGAGARGECRVWVIG